MIFAQLVAADDQMLCAAILHDTVDDTPYTLTELRRDFGAEVAKMVAGISALDHIGRSRHYMVDQALATIGSADTRVVAIKLVDRLHNMRTLQFLPPEKQLRK